MSRWVEAKAIMKKSEDVVNNVLYRDYIQGLKLNVVRPDLSFEEYKRIRLNK